tara:strand:+ start:9890 stop:11059 length:1170 start_codon:yes stop_codon:yes gene_type:complete
MALNKVRGEMVDLNSTGNTKGLKMPSGTAFPSGENAVQGMIRNDTNQTSEGASSTMQHYNGSSWKNFVNITPQATFEVLMAGGGGGTGTSAGGGGGGAGGILTGSLTIDKGTQIAITVGNGGSGNGSQTYATVGVNGDDTVLAISGGTTYTADGGGGGGANNSGQSTGNGGSGGGNGGYGIGGSDSGQGTSTQTNQNGSEGNLTGHGNNGGATSGVNSPCCFYVGAGGGGAGTAGSPTQNSAGYGGAGGDGIVSTILSTSDVSTYISASLVDGGNVYFGGGGGGGSENNFSATFNAPGGKGGGGDGVGGASPIVGNNGIDYSGGGSGGSNNTVTGLSNRGSGGKGVVIIRVLESNKGTAASSGTVESFLASDNNNFRIFIFKDSGTYTV